MLALHGLHGFLNCLLLIYGLILLFGSVVFLTHLVEHSLLFCREPSIASRRRSILLGVPRQLWRLVGGLRWCTLC